MQSSRHLFSTAAGWISLLTGVAALVVLARFPFGLMTHTYFRQSLISSHIDERMIAAREGSTETVFLMLNDWLGRPVHYRLVTNGFSMSATHLTAKRYMRS